jgi:hypothetical protein
LLRIARVNISITPHFARQLLLLSDEEYEQADEAFAAAKGRGLVHQGTKCRGLVYLGKVKILVLFCRFKDHGQRELTPPSNYEELNDKGPYPIGSVREYIDYGPPRFDCTRPRQSSTPSIGSHV